LMMAVIRNGHLWTTRTIGVNSSGGATGADRTGVEWFDLNISASSLVINQTGRIFDTAASNPRFYYDPSLTVTGQGLMRLGFSGSKSTELIGASSSFRLASDPANTTSAPVLIKAGERAYSPGNNRWGDYSYTSVDPNNDMTAWTIQEYASNVTPSSSRWGTWVQSFDAPAPTLNNPAAVVAPGRTGVTLNLTGTRLFDPGAGFANHLAVAITGGSVNGISNLIATYNSPTSVTVTFDVAANASGGPRDIVLTNPDGQSVTVSGGLVVDNTAPVLQSFVRQT